MSRAGKPFRPRTSTQGRRAPACEYAGVAALWRKELDDKIRQLADLVLDAERTLVLTGAGISTALGIPGFRSPRTRLWTKVDPLSVMSLAAFRADPTNFYRVLRRLVGRWRDAQPKPAHLALAELESWGLVTSIITQNVDNLHQAAGSTRVWELHGHLCEATCQACHNTCSLDGHVDAYLSTGTTPRCAECGGVLKPEMILFGEQLPRSVYMEVMGEIESRDLIIVAGSSLTVAPVSEFPFWAQRHGAKLVIINDAPTLADDTALVVIRDRVERALPRLADICRERMERGCLAQLGGDCPSQEPPSGSEPEDASGALRFRRFARMHAPRLPRLGIRRRGRSGSRRCGGRSELHHSVALGGQHMVIPNSGV